jgi:biotin carboxyl carrier protein
MKRRVEWNQQTYQLEVEHDHFRLVPENKDAAVQEGEASVVEIRQGSYSILFESGESVMVDLAASGAAHDVLSDQTRYQITLTDPRDSRAGSNNRDQSGPAEVRSVMPGKIIKVLVKEGQTVENGTALLVMEAMKMQNETKSPKDGVVRRVHVAEGTAVSAGELLLVIG